MDFSLDIEIAEHNLQTVELNRQIALPVSNKNSSSYSFFSYNAQLNNRIKNFNNIAKTKTDSEMFIYHIV